MDVAEVERIPASSSRWVRDERDPHAFRVSRSVFTDELLFGREGASVFDRCWLYVGHDSEIPRPGDFVRRQIGGRNVIFVRDPVGAPRVWLNACTHRGAEVCRQPRGNTSRFRCFYHSWSFSTDGVLAAIPERHAYPPDFDTSQMGLTGPAQLDSYRGFYFCTYDPSATDLRSYLAGVTEYLDLTCDQSEVAMEVLAGTHEYSVRANWKLLMENSADGYHALPVHKTYFDVQRRRGDNATTSNESFTASHAYDLGNGHAVTVKQAPWGRPVARWFPSMGEDARPVVEEAAARLIERFGPDYGHRVANLDFNMLVFPNLVINNIMAVIIRKIEPIDVDEMHVTAWSLGPSEEGPAARSARNQAFLSFLGPAGLATPDDNEALESCQRAFKNLSGPGWNDASRGMGKTDQSSYDELQQRTFWRRWQQLVGGQ